VTERLYYRNSYATDFHADVIVVLDVSGRTGVVLNRTAFYPASGGQPADTGTLGDARVVDVVNAEDGQIVHIVTGPTPSGRVSGRVTWARRFDHMQQHTGQHVLSAAFERLLGVGTVSFHLGSDASTIDLAREVTAEELAAAEDLANEVVWEDRTVSVRFADAEEAVGLPLRKPTDRQGPLRIVEVEDFDTSACGGTHVARTGAIGMIAVASAERFRGGSRVEFRCGGRALGAYRLLRDSAAVSSRLLSVGPHELGAGVERLLAEGKEARRRLQDAEERLVAHEAAALATGAVEIGGGRLVIASVDRADPAALKVLAQAISLAGCGAILATSASPVSVVVSSGPHTGLDAARMLKRLTEQFGGKGGGRRELAQGGGLSGAPDRVLAAARTLVTKADTAG